MITAVRTFLILVLGCSSSPGCLEYQEHQFIVQSAATGEPIAGVCLSVHYVGMAVPSPSGMLASWFASPKTVTDAEGRATLHIADVKDGFAEVIVEVADDGPYRGAVTPIVRHYWETDAYVVRWDEEVFVIELKRRDMKQERDR